MLKLYMLNPLAVIFQSFKHAAINHDTPSAGALLGSSALVLIPIAIVLVIFVSVCIRSTGSRRASPRICSGQ